MNKGEEARQFSSLAEAVKDAYANGEEDERLEPIVVVDENGSPLGRFKNGDYVIFYDIRGEREIQITKAFMDENFDAFPVEKLGLNFVTMIEYDKSLKVKVVFPPQEKMKDTLCHVLSNHGYKYIKIVESEKAFHLSYFFNGKSSEPLPGEERLIIPSLKVTIPDENPEMRIEVANLANVDVVGHTENEAAIIKAIEAVDSSLGEIIDEARKEGVTSIITADHGTVESWLYPDGTIDTGHTSSQVPFILVEPDDSLLKGIKLKEKGELTDVTPTIFNILGLEKPGIMTGKSLLAKNPYEGHARNRLLLLILDGWGINDETKGNLIKKAGTPSMDSLVNNFPNIRLDASGEAVGMPSGSVGNSEVGHLHLGAGRRIPSDRLRIDNAIKDRSYFENSVLLEAIRGAKSSNHNLHLLGIVSFYSSHGSIEHLKALLRMTKSEGFEKIYIHSILGRRGEHAQSGERYIDEIEQFTKKLNLGEVVTVIGRHWVLDREENWDRIEKAYKSLVYGEGKKVTMNRTG
jgi:2,3-bisphosphoglycerate-independent phosphoglycerate mutase